MPSKTKTATAAGKAAQLQIPPSCWTLQKVHSQRHPAHLLRNLQMVLASGNSPAAGSKPVKTMKSMRTFKACSSCASDRPCHCPSSMSLNMDSGAYGSGPPPWVSSRRYRPLSLWETASQSMSWCSFQVGESSTRGLAPTRKKLSSVISISRCSDDLLDPNHQPNTIRIFTSYAAVLGWTQGTRLLCPVALWPSCLNSDLQQSVLTGVLPMPYPCK